MAGARAPLARTEDDVLLLAERYMTELNDLRGRILQQRAVLRDVGPSQRWRARRMLRRLEDLAETYRRGLDRLRSGRPHCQACEDPIEVARLLIDPLALDCRTCPPWQDRPYPREVST